MLQKMYIFIHSGVMVLITDFPSLMTLVPIFTSAKEVFFSCLFVSLLVSMILHKYYWLDLPEKKIRGWVLVQLKL